jgi:hypothetical protein
MKWISRSAIAFVMLTGTTLPTMAQPTYVPWPAPQTRGFSIGTPEPPPGFDKFPCANRLRFVSRTL